MDPILSAILLGLVEGITEFLPVSSTGHLIIMDALLGFTGPAGKAFEISIQLGAILAICWLYREKILKTLTTLKQKNSQHFAFTILAAFLPAAILGFLFHHAITELLFNVRVVAATFILGGIAIIVIEKVKPKPSVKTVEGISVKKAIAIGFCQALAMIPGVSRSGATIMGALCLKVERQAAAEFSFFLAIPTMFAATAYELFKTRHELTADGISLIAIGFITAFISALLVVKWFIRFISKHGFIPFAWYRIAVGILMFVLIYLHPFA